MKRILFLIVCLMSFSAKADMEELWQEYLPPFETTLVKAYCVFVDDTAKTGTVFVYTFKESQNVPQEVISVEQLMTNRTGKNKNAMSIGVVSCKRQG